METEEQSTTGDKLDEEIKAILLQEQEPLISPPEWELSTREKYLISKPIYQLSDCMKLS